MVNGQLDVAAPVKAIGKSNARVCVSGNFLFAKNYVYKT